MVIRYIRFYLFMPYTEYDMKDTVVTVDECYYSKFGIRKVKFTTWL